MMTRYKHAVTGFLLLGLLAGCGSSPPINYYVLTPQSNVVPTATKPVIGVGPVSIPEYLNRDNLVTHREANVLSVANSERWAEPLTDGVQRVLAINLASLLNTQDVRLFPWHPQQPPDYGVRITLLSLDADEETASLAAEWAVYRPEGKETVARRLHRLETPLRGDKLQSEKIAAAYSDLMFQLSEVIATAIKSQRTPGTDDQ